MGESYRYSGIAVTSENCYFTWWSNIGFIGVPYSFRQTHFGIWPGTRMFGDWRWIDQLNACPWCTQRTASLGKSICARLWIQPHVAEHWCHGAIVAPLLPVTQWSEVCSAYPQRGEQECISSAGPGLELCQSWNVLKCAEMCWNVLNLTGKSPVTSFTSIWANMFKRPSFGVPQENRGLKPLKK